MIEKLGHSKRMQVMRKQWINEGKARHSQSVEDDMTGKDARKGLGSQGEEQRQTGRQADREFPMENQNTAPRSRSSEPNVAATSDRRDDGTAKAGESLFVSDDDQDSELREPPEDDLDALLAEDDARQCATTPTSGVNKDNGFTKPDNFDDEEEAMAGMDDMW